MSRKERANFTQAEKAAILRRHFLDNVPVSELCAEYKIHVSTFYIWQKKMFEGGLGEGKVHVSGRERDLERKVAALEAKLSRKDAVIAEVTQEYVALKKVLGRTERQVGGS